MEYENKNISVQENSEEQIEQTPDQGDDIQRIDVDQLNQVASEQEDTATEKESFFVRTRLGQLALKMATDPTVSLNVASAGLNTFVNVHGTPTVLNTGLAVASTIAATWRAADIANKHLSEREQAEARQ